MFLFLLSSGSCDEAFRKQLKAKYAKHKTMSYKNARIEMYNNVDCENNQIHLIYGGNTYSWKCHQKKIPSATYVNAEHIVPQSLFNKKTPYVSDLHHLLSSPSKLNNRRSNFKFGNVNDDDCRYWCIDNDCSTSRPSKNTEEYSCLSVNNIWKPRDADKGEVARAVLYFFTMYDELSFGVSSVGNLKTFIDWSNKYPPSAREIARNKAINQSQGNSNPYVEDPSLVNKAWA